MIKKLILLFTILSFVPFSKAAYDVNDVSVRGDATVMGMRIEGTYFSDNAFLVETTGARFEYVQGCLKLFQGLDPTNRRLLATIEFDSSPDFVTVESTKDHIYFWSEELNIGIYGDSTLLISPKKRQLLKCNGHFKPDYEGRYRGELLLIDDRGGMEIYPQRYGSSYRVRTIELGKTDWIADYELNAGQRVMVAAFPGRPFDWEKSFECNTVFTCGSVGLGQGNIFGEMPPASVVKKWSEDFQIIVMFPFGLYKNYSPGSPYIVENESELNRVIKAAHDNNMKFAIYTSFFYYVRQHNSFDGFYESVVALKEKFSIDGVYIDGPTFDNAGRKLIDRIGDWEMIRRLRQLFGAEGVIYLHGTQTGGPVDTRPNLDVYCDVTLNGERIPFRSLADPYIRYHVRKYGISNTVATWKMGPHPNSISYKDAISELLKLNGRERWGFFVPTKKAPTEGKYIWPVDGGTGLAFYLHEFEKIKNKYYLSKNRPIEE